MMNTVFQLGGGALTSNRATFSLFIKKVFHQVKSFFKRENKNFAFTLAETLIVMGIIGVVAALTIPNLNASTGEAEKVAKVKKNYAVLNEALSRAVVKYGPVRTWFVNDGDDSDKMSKRFADRISEFLKLTKSIEKDGDYYTFTLADGTSVYINYFGFNEYEYCSSSPVSAYYLGNLDIDIDGDKGKSIEGIDKFAFDITDIGLIPIGGRGWDLSCDCGHWCCSPYYQKYNDGTEYYYGAALWVITHGNMDYLKCGEDLDWDTKTSCK